MRARFGTKLLIIVIALLLLVFGAATLYLGIRLNALELTAPSTDVINDVVKAEKAVFNGEGYWTLRRIVVLAIGAIEVLSAIFLMTIPSKLRYKKGDFIVQQTENGEIRIAVRAVENLVRKCTDMHDEIDVSGLRISNHRDGVSVDLKVALPNNISIPLAVESLQKQIKQYVTVSTGVSVRDVRVAVVNTKEALQVESPYDVDKAAEEREPEEKAVHERVFEEPEQEAPAPAAPAVPADPPAQMFAPQAAEPVPEEAPAADAAGEAPAEEAAQDTEEYTTHFDGTQE